MLIVISPAKTLDMSAGKHREYTQAGLLEHSMQLLDLLRPMNSAEIGQLMSISEDLANLNVVRYASWQPQMDLQNAKQAILSFAGDVYDGLAASEMSLTQLRYAQQHLRILSGLYGVLRPLDLMQAYRLEMGTRLGNPRGRDLYAFWGQLVTQELLGCIQEQKAPALINLASEEYFKVVKPSMLPVPVITPVFEDWKNGKYKIISFFAKRARGSMARYILLNKLKKPMQIQAFAEDGYAFAPQVSTEHKWVFRRQHEAV